MTQHQYIKKCREVHNNKYNYSLVNYKNIDTKIKIICPEHGIFEQNAKNHKNGQGCKFCSGSYKRTAEEFIKKSKEINGDKYDYSLVEYLNSTTKVKLIDKETGIIFEQIPYLNLKGLTPRLNKELFIEKSKNIHDDKYDYSLVEYLNSTTKVKIKCKEYGFVFEQSPRRHLEGYGPGKVTPEIFIKKCLKIHNNKYNYSLVNKIKNGKVKVEIICPEHGIFKQSVSNHMNLKQGCPKCSGLGVTFREVIDRYKEEHNNKYDYSLLIPIKFNKVKWGKKMKIICPEHGIFKQLPSKHLYQGCPHCKCLSKGENKISKILNKNNINFIKEHSFEDCKNIKRLPFDFYLPDGNICIEYDGIQHFRPVDFFGGEEYFKERQKIDDIKTKYCDDNNIYLIRIPYTEYGNIDFIIKEKIIDVLSV